MKFGDLLTPELIRSLHKRELPFEYGPDNPWCPSIVYREDLGRELEAVFEWLMNTVTWKSDLEVRGVVEHWGLPKEINGGWFGDCDDFASAYRFSLKKPGENEYVLQEASRLILKELGWDEQVLRRLVCFVPTVEKREPSSPDDFNHAILGVSIFRKGKTFLIFDNRMQRVKTLAELVENWGYRNFNICSVFHNGEYRRVNIG